MRLKSYSCPNYIIALLRELERQLCRVMWNNNQKEYDSPFSNTGNNFKCDVFEVNAYDWDEDSNQMYNFKYKNIEISWYKYLGRCTTINGVYDTQIIIEMFDNCLKEILNLEEDDFL